MAVSRTPGIDHSAHDALLLAALASGDALEAADRARADAQVRDCASCAALLSDLVAIRAATVELPVPRRRRDFRLTEADAVRLRPAGWRRILVAFGSPRARLAGPASLGLATLGIAGLLLATVPMAPLAERSGAIATSADANGAAVAAAPAATAAPAPTPPPVPVPTPAAAETAAPFGGAQVAETPGAESLKIAPLLPGVTAAPSAAASAEAPPRAASPTTGIAVAPNASASSATVAGSPGDLARAEAGTPAAAAAAQTALPTSPGEPGPPWLAMTSAVLLAAGLVLGGLRLAGRRATSR